MRYLPFIFFPKHSGLRQPIHAKQVGSLSIFYSKIIYDQLHNEQEFYFNETFEIGGDEILSYSEMLLKIQKSLPTKDKARNCKVILVPNRIFYFLSSFVVFFSPKIFESLLRISADLSDFSKPYEIMNSEQKKFPLE